MPRIQELQVGDELHCYMRIGYALETVRNADGSVVRVVPQKPRKAGPGDLTNFVGQVVRNDSVRGFLVMNTQDMNASYKPTDAMGSLQALIPYAAFKRVFRLSKYAHEPTQNTITRPTRLHRHNRPRPYHTKELVDL